MYRFLTRGFCLDQCVGALQKLLQVTKEEKKDLFQEDEAKKVFLQVFFLSLFWTVNVHLIKGIGHKLLEVRWP